MFPNIFVLMISDTNNVSLQDNRPAYFLIVLTLFIKIDLIIDIKVIHISNKP